MGLRHLSGLSHRNKKPGISPPASSVFFLQMSSPENPQLCGARPYGCLSNCVMTWLSSLASGGSETRCRGKRRSWLGGPVRRLAGSPCLALANAQCLGKSTEPLWPNPGHWSFARCCLLAHERYMVTMRSLYLIFPQSKKVEMIRTMKARPNINTKTSTPFI